MSKGKKYSSFLTEQKIFDNWRNYLNENREDIKEVEIVPRKSRDRASGWGTAAGGVAGAAIGTLLPVGVTTVAGAGIGFGVGRFISNVINSRINQGILDRLAKAKVSEETLMKTAQTLFDEAKAELEKEGEPVPDDVIAKGVGEWLNTSLDSARLSPEQMEEIRFDEKTLRDLSDNVQLEDVVVDVLSKKNMLVGDTLGTTIRRGLEKGTAAIDPGGAMANYAGRLSHKLAQEKLSKGKKK